MRYAIIFCLAFSSTALAEPIPKESEEAKIKRVWGELIDPEKKTKTKLTGNKLHLTIPSGPYVPNNGHSNFKQPPYLKNSVQGDFVATVKVIRHAPPQDSVLNGDSTAALTASGLIVESEETNRITFSLAARAVKDENQFRFTMRSNAQFSVSSSMSESKTESAMLRISRTSDSFKSEYSFDEGKTWGYYISQKLNMQSEVVVGVYAEHIVNSETTAVFEGFEITKPKK